MKSKNLTVNVIKQIEIQYKRINNESIRVYDAKTKKLFVRDNIDFNLSEQALKNDMKR